MSVEARFRATLKHICLIVAVGVLTHGILPTVVRGQTTDSKKAITPAKAGRPEIILIDGVLSSAIYNRARAQKLGQQGINVDDLYRKLRHRPYMLDLEVRHEEWDRLDYIRAREPRVVIVGVHAFAEKAATNPYASTRLAENLISPLAGTNIKFLVYYRGEPYDKLEIEPILCLAFSSTKKKGVCEQRIAIVHADQASFPSDAFIDRLSKELERLLQ